MHLGGPALTTAHVAPPRQFYQTRTDHRTGPKKVSPALCPNGHEVRPGFTVSEWKAVLDGDTLFHCAICDIDWKATAKQKVNIQLYLEEHSS